MFYATPAMLKAIYALNADAFDKIYGPAERSDIARLVQVDERPISSDQLATHPELLRDVDVILSGWGGPKLDEALLSHAPKLSAVFYGAGSLKGIVTPAFWARKIPITSSYAANAVPVAEFTLAEILFSLKLGWRPIFESREKRQRTRVPVPGAYGTTVGLVSLGMIGRRVAQLLGTFDVKVIAYDPFINRDTAESLNVEMVPLLDVFARSQVVSLHTPWLKETENMIGGEHFRAMKKDATFINTARGAVVNEAQMAQVLAERPDLWAVLDVTYPEPPAADSPLWTLPNVVLTPHIAGSLDQECRRMGRVVADELNRFVQQQPLVWSIDEARAATLA